MLAFFPPFRLLGSVHTYTQNTKQTNKQNFSMHSSVFSLTWTKWHHPSPVGNYKIVLWISMVPRISSITYFLKINTKFRKQNKTQKNSTISRESKTKTQNHITTKQNHCNNQRNPNTDMAHNWLILVEKPCTQKKGNRDMHRTSCAKANKASTNTAWSTQKGKYLSQLSAHCMHKVKILEKNFYGMHNVQQGNGMQHTHTLSFAKILQQNKKNATLFDSKTKVNLIFT